VYFECETFFECVLSVYSTDGTDSTEYYSQLCIDCVWRAFLSVYTGLF